MRIYVTGASGLVGRELVPILAAARHAVAGEERVDVRDPEAVARAVARARPDWVIHLAAYTRVDEAESHEPEARAVNVDGTEQVARAARAAGARLLYMSTDYVYDGEKPAPYVEDDPPAPRSAYGRSKLDGERRAAAVLPECLIVRGGWLYGREKGFVNAILAAAAARPRLEVVEDEEGSPTYAPDLARALAALVEAGASGIVHAANQGGTSRYALARAALELAGDDPAKVVPTTRAAFGRPAARPRYAVLACARYARLTGAVLRPWRDALAEHVALRAKEVAR